MHRSVVFFPSLFEHTRVLLVDSVPRRYMQVEKLEDLDAVTDMAEVDLGGFIDRVPFLRDEFNTKVSRTCTNVFMDFCF